jgi:hypothetical protein
MNAVRSTPGVEGLRFFSRGAAPLIAREKNLKNSSAIVSSEIPPRRKVVVPRVEKNRPFHAGSIAALFNNCGRSRGED